MNRSSCLRIFVAVVLLATALLTASSGGKSPAKPVKVLCLGSSSMYFHDMPRDAAAWLTRWAGTPAQAELAGRSGTAVYKYLQPGFKMEFGVAPDQTVLDKIRLGEYQFVILQVPTDYLAGRGDNSRDEFIAGIDTYIQAIRQSGAKPLFYEQGWGEDELFDTGDRLLFELAQKHEVPVAPCRSAWKRIRQERPDLELHNLPDRTHPGTLGKYVNLCCFYAALTGKSPVGVPVREVSYWPPLTDEQKKQARDRLTDNVVQDPYMRQLAGWMRVRSVMSETTKLDGETAAYFQKVAWETWQAYNRRLNDL